MNKKDSSDTMFEEEEVVDFELNSESFKEISSYNTDLSVDLLVTYDEKSKLIFDPEFQRRYVWDDKRKSKFIESLILNLPVPSILLANDIETNKFIIIDGKQRLSAILDFVAEKKNGEGFKLKGLEILKDLEGFTYKMLCEDPEKMSLLSQLETYSIKSTIVKNYEEKLLYFIFARLNSGSVSLSQQELRHTLYPGEFSNFINDNSQKSEGIRRILKLKTTDVFDSRMRDAELLSRFFAFKYFQKNYSNTVGSILDYTYETLNKQWEEYKEKINSDLLEFEESVKFVYEAMPEDAFKIYKTEENKYGIFNRLMFDILTITFSDSTIRNNFLQKDINLNNFIVDAFEDSDFEQLFKPVTSSKEKTLKRFELFLDKVNNVLKG